MSRLDYFLVPCENLNFVENCQITSGILSDHHFVELSILLNDQIKGRGYWKFNVSLLRDKEYVNQINELIDRSLYTHRYKDPCICWEILKMEVTELLQSYSKKVAHTRKEKIKNLHKRIMNLEKKLSCINLQAQNAIDIIPKTNIKIDNLRQELQKEHDYATQGAILRSKSKFYEMGEHSSKYFFLIGKKECKEKKHGRCF